MPILKTITHEEIGLELSSSSTYKERHAARAVLFDADDKVALLHVTEDNYHKLPGGGIEAGETMQDGFERELLEETGCKAEVTEQLGEIVELRDNFQLKQTSTCFIAHVYEKGQPAFTDWERSKGFELIWVSLKEAIELIENDLPDDYEGKFIVIRDLAFLNKAKELLS